MAGCGAFLAILSTPAWAHVEVGADKPQAGATNVTITFTGEAESTTAGIQSERVVLPDGIAPQQVKLSKAPAGWTYQALNDGFQVSGKPLPIGKAAVWAIVVDKLPDDATELPFKTVEKYGDGEVANWIEVPQPGQTDLPDPAPVLTVAAASGSTTAVSATLIATAPTTSTPTSTGSRSGWWITLAVIAILALAVGFVFIRRRRDQSR